MTDPRLARPLWRGRSNVDALTISCIERAERMVGHQFVVTQGSYQSTVAASGGTHDRGGAVDLRWCGHNECILALRKSGMAATWHRKPSQGPWPDHTHGVVYGHPDLSPAAARQITSVLGGGNGLKGNGPDDGPRPEPFIPAIWPPLPEDDMNPAQEKTLNDTAAAVKRLEADLLTFRRTFNVRDKASQVREIEAIRQGVKANKSNEQIAADVEKLREGK